MNYLIRSSNMYRTLEDGCHTAEILCKNNGVALAENVVDAVLLKVASHV